MTRRTTKLYNVAHQIQKQNSKFIKHSETQAMLGHGQRPVCVAETVLGGSSLLDGSGGRLNFGKEIGDLNT